jgi:hypothetical protein
MIDFTGIWPGGYFEGDPLDPKASSSYESRSYMSILHATYLRCIKPYVADYINALEIGSGRGAWTKCMLGFAEVHVLEVLPENSIGIREYLNNPPNLYYHDITKEDYTETIQDYYFNFMFSFGVLCHLPFNELERFAQNLHDKIDMDNDCFWMISDYKKAGLPQDKDELPRPGRWYNNDLERTCIMLEREGYRIIDPDVGTNLRDPIIHFRRVER